jgi:hypothetical protein
MTEIKIERLGQYMSPSILDQYTYASLKPAQMPVIPLPIPKKMAMPQVNRVPEYRMLDRSGVCSICYADVQRKTQKVIVFYGKREYVIICKRCLPKIEDAIRHG